MPLFINLRASSIENGWLPNFSPLNLGSSACSISLVNRQADFILLYPVGDYAKNLAGFLLSDFIYPYFRVRVCPVHVDDHFTIHTVTGMLLCVLDIGPWEYGLVTSETHIMLAKSMENEVVPAPSDDALECAQQLQREVDYRSTRDYGRRIVDFAVYTQKLVDLLEAPPLYTEGPSNAY